MARKNWELFFVAIFFSLLLFGISITFFMKEGISVFQILNDGRKTTGKIIDVVHGYSGKDSTMTHKIKYSTEVETFIIMAHFVDANYRKLGIGDTVIVLYSKKNPVVAKVYSGIYLPLIFSATSSIISLFLIGLSIKKKEWLITREGGPWPYG